MFYFEVVFIGIRVYREIWGSQLLLGAIWGVHGVWGRRLDFTQEGGLQGSWDSHLHLWGFGVFIEMGTEVVLFLLLGLRWRGGGFPPAIRSIWGVSLGYNLEEFRLCIFMCKWGFC